MVGGESLAHRKVYSIVEFGAYDDGQTDATEAIRRAIYACVAEGGGIVEIPAGVYLTGPFELFSNITLKLNDGAKLVATTDIAAYPEVRLSMECPRAGLIRARYAQHVRVVGGGCIDLQGTQFMDNQRMHDGADYDRRFTR